MKPKNAIRPFLAAIGSSLLVASSASAANYYFDGGGTTTTGLGWGTNTVWSTDLAGTTDPAGSPVSSDDVIFSITGALDGVVGMNAARAANSLTFSSSVANTLMAHTTTTTANSLTIGAGGINIDSGAGAVTFGVSTRGILTTTLGASQSWAHNGSNLFSVTQAVALGANTLTLAGNGGGNTTISGAIGGTGGAVTINRSGSGIVSFGGSNGFSGQLTIARGTLSIASINNASAAGTLGNSALAVILGSSGNTGTLSYTGGTASSTKAFTLATGGTGAIDVSNAATNLTLSGAIGGSGNLVKTGDGRLILTSSSSNYSGKTVVNAGYLRFGTTWNDSWANGRLSANSNLEINGGVVEAYYYKTFALGSGAGQLQLTGGRSGFTNMQGDATGQAFVVFGTTASTVTWDNTGTFAPSTLVLNDVGASAVLRISNPFDLNGAQRTVEVSATGAGGGRGTYGTMEGILSGAGGSLRKIGAGTLMLNGANTYGGGTTIDGGVLWFRGTATMPASGEVAVNTGGTIGISLGGTGNWTTGTSGVGTLGGLLAGSGGSGISTVSYSGDVGLALILGTTSVQTYSGNIANVGDSLSLSIGNKDGSTNQDPFAASAGTLVLSGTNTYTGKTSILTSGATLRFANQNSLYNNTDTSWTAANLNVKSGATLAFNVGGSGEFTTGNVTTLLTNLSASTGAGNGMESGSILAFDTTNATGGTFTIADTITNTTGAGGGARGLTKLGTNALILSGPNTFTGTTTVSGGTLQAGIASVAGVSGAFGLNNTVTLANTAGVTLALNGFETRIGALTGGGTTGGNVTLGGATLTIGTSNSNNVNFAGVISGDGNLVKTGTGVNTLSGNNTYNGTTTVSQGVLDFAGGTLGFGGGSGRNITVADGAGVRFNNLTNTQLNRIVETNEEITVMTGTTTSGAVDFSSNTGANLPNAFLGNWAGNGAKAEYNVTITPASDNYRLGGKGSSGLLGIQSVLSGSQGLIVGGTGATGIRVNLVAANTFSGETVINGGARLTLGNNLALQNSALNVGSAGGNFSLAAGTNGGRIVGETAASSPTFGGLVGSRNLLTVFSNSAGNNESNLAATAVTGFTLNPGAGKSHTYTGVIANFAPNTTINKTGAGTQTFGGTATHTYSGATTISAGTLEIAGSATINSSAVTINGSTADFRYNSSVAYSNTLTYTSGTISGSNWTGSLNGLTIGSNKTVSPGNSPGTATTGSQTWASGGSYLWEINNVMGAAGEDPGWDLLSGTGTLNITAASGSEFNILVTSLTLANAAGLAANFNDAMNYTWLIADFNSITGFAKNAFNIDTNGFDNSFTGSFDVSLGGVDAVPGDNSQIYLTYTPIPEPRAALLGGIGLLMLLRRRR